MVRSIAPALLLAASPGLFAEVHVQRCTSVREIDVEVADWGDFQGRLCEGGTLPLVLDRIGPGPRAGDEARLAGTVQRRTGAWVISLGREATPETPLWTGVSIHEGAGSSPLEATSPSTPKASLRIREVTDVRLPFEYRIINRTNQEAMDAVAGAAGWTVSGDAPEDGRITLQFAAIGAETAIALIADNGNRMVAWTAEGQPVLVTLADHGDLDAVFDALDSVLSGSDEAALDAAIAAVIERTDPSRLPHAPWRALQALNAAAEASVSRNDLDTAIRIRRHLLTFAERQDARAGALTTANARAELAHVLQLAGDPGAESRALVDEARPVAVAAASDLWDLVAVGRIGTAYLEAGQFEVAERILSAGLARSDRTDPGQWAYDTDLITAGLLRIHRRLGRFDAANALAATWRDVTIGEPVQFPLALERAAARESEAGRVDEAARIQDVAFQRLPPLRDVPVDDLAYRLTQSFTAHLVAGNHAEVAQVQSLVAPMAGKPKSGDELDRAPDVARADRFWRRVAEIAPARRGPVDTLYRLPRAQLPDLGVMDYRFDLGTFARVKLQAMLDPILQSSGNLPATRASHAEALALAILATGLPGTIDSEAMVWFERAQAARRAAGASDEALAERKAWFESVQEAWTSIGNAT